MFEKAGYKTVTSASGTRLRCREAGRKDSQQAVGGFVPPERRRGYQEWNGYEKAHEYFEVWKYNEKGERNALQDTIGNRPGTRIWRWIRQAALDRGEPCSTTSPTGRRMCRNNALNDS